MDSTLIRKIISNKTKEVNVDQIKIGDLVNICEDFKGNVLIVDLKSNIIKKILSNGNDTTSAILKKGNTFTVMNVEEFLECFGQVASIEQKTKNAPLVIKFKEKVKGSQEHTFRARDKIRKVV